MIRTVGELIDVLSHYNRDDLIMLAHSPETEGNILQAVEHNYYSIEYFGDRGTFWPVTTKEEIDNRAKSGERLIRPVVLYLL